MGLWVPVELSVDFLRKNPLWAKMTKLVENLEKKHAAEKMQIQKSHFFAPKIEKMGQK